MIVNTNNLRRRRTAFLSGLGALYDTSPVNPTTIWTPTTGFLSKPGDITSGQPQNQPTSVYDVPGLLLPYQTCLDAMGGSGGSGACVDQNLATQQQNFQRTAQYNAGTLTLNAPPPPPLSPPAPGSGSSGICSQPNYYDKTGVCIDPFSLQPIPGVMKQNIIPPPSTPLPTSTNNQVNTQSPATQQNQMLDGSGSGISTLTSDLGSDVNILGFQVPIWAVGLAAVGVIAMVAGGRH